MTFPNLQQLAPQWARFCLGIERFITNDLQTRIHGNKLVIAYSTGADSTALLHILHILAPRLGLSLAAAHLNHMIRPESAHEQDIAKATCQRLGIPFEGHAADIPALAQAQGQGIEETARNERYRFLEEVRAARNAHYIVTAHHADDLAEDVLMRLIRGTGWPALAGMPGCDPKRHLLRPLLGTPKQTLVEFLTCLGVSWEEDTSNNDVSFLRNRVRKQMLPLFLQENPDFLKSIGQLWQCGQADRAFWEQRITDHLEDQKQEIPGHLASLPRAERCRILKHAVEGMGPGQVRAEAIFKLDDLWQHKATGKTVQFPGNKQATITANQHISLSFKKT